MIYFVTNNKELFESSDYTILSVIESLKLIEKWDYIQFDTETTGLDPHICDLMCIQMGYSDDCSIVVDCSSVDILAYKDILENKLLIGHNLKFDLQFLYKYNIIPRNLYDTMIVEQLLYLGYPNGMISYSLASVAYRRLDIKLDKTIREQIVKRGLDLDVIIYAANDVKYLYDIMQHQVKECRQKDCLTAAKLECDTIPSMAYLEWCGIKLDINKWKTKMQQDKLNLDNAKKALDEFIISKYEEEPSKYVSFVEKKIQYSLFDDNSDVGKMFCNVNWASSRQVIPIAKLLGFNTVTQDKVTGQNKESVIEKLLTCQKGICDEFLKLYFEYQGYAKLVTSFGQGHIDAINPKTGRIHTVYRQLGAASGRMSCGSSQSNTDLEQYKKLPKGSCKLPNMQQLPHDELTRSCFVAEEGNLWCSCDWSAAEARLAGDIYNDKAIIEMFEKGIDSHSFYAKTFFAEELKNIDVNDIKKLRPDLRQKAKAPEFALNFGGGVSAIMSSIQCTREEAEVMIRNYESVFSGTAAFAKKGSRELRKNGYVLMCKTTGHKMFWWDFDEWNKRQSTFTSQFWEDYKLNHKGTGDYIDNEVKTHFKASSKWDRMVRNGPTQGTCSIMLKESLINLFNFIVDNHYFNQIKISNATHDELNVEFPETFEDFPNILVNIMENAAAKYCKALPIPAEASVGKCWIH